MLATLIMLWTLPGLLAKLARRRGPACLKKGLLILCLLVSFWLDPPREVSLMPDAGDREAVEELGGRALQGLPRPKSHLPPEEPLSEPAVYLQHVAMLNI